MKVWFGQIYGIPGASFPFSHLFQRHLSSEVTARVEASPKFVKQYGEDFELMFNVSAKPGLRDIEIRGPAVYKKTKDVEYTVFLPFDVIIPHADAPRRAIRFLLKGVCEVFDRLEIDTSRLRAEQDGILEGMCSDPSMLAEPAWDEDRHPSPGRAVFERFFARDRSR
jgi:hypothetical protein